ncbi:MAG: macrocin O-methyltransferase [Weeksellaceae bacterium]|nr:macrocin O-methyltransferase [Weeksellaceae bacterium]
MTSIERAFALFEACKYVIKNNIEGDFVECGAWKGGSAMIMAYVLLLLNEHDRQIFLYDTFEGMSEPGVQDIDVNGISAKELLQKDDSKTGHVWARSPEDEVRSNLYSTGYNKENIHFIKGKVEYKIPEFSPKQISLLRLDTDWYESTKHELVHLYPLLSQSGILIIDDYGHWAGARKAVDEYFTGINEKVFLNRIDYTGRLIIKQ